MYDNYMDIFNKRGDSYCYAMKKCTSSRDNEFLQLLKYFPINNNDVIADIPCGACYLSKYIQNNTTIYYIDESEVFLKNCEKRYNLLKTSINNIPLKSSYFDKIFSLAGTHHIENKEPFYIEVKRLLKKNGNFIYADVLEGSKEDKFLNYFVNKNNSLGHKGIFLNDTTVSSLNTIGLNVYRSEYINVKWTFDNESEMINFVKNIFGLDLASNENILRSIKNILGYTVEDNLIVMNWGLFYIYAINRKI